MLIVQLFLIASILETAQILSKTRYWNYNILGLECVWG